MNKQRLLATDTVQSPRPPRPAGQPPAGANRAGLLHSYLQDISPIPLLTAEEEIDWAERLEKLDVDFWTTALRHAALRRRCIALVMEALLSQSEQDESLVNGMIKLSKNRRDLCRSNRDIAKLAATLRRRDIDRDIADTLMMQVIDTRPKGVDSALEKQQRQEIRSSYRAGQRLRNQFIEANLRLVVTIAARYRNDNLSLGDLIQEGNIGLIKAVNRYDYRRGLRFSTYASWWIRHSIGRSLADNGRLVRVPVHMLDSQRRVNKVRRELAKQLGRAANDEETATEAGLPLDQLQALDRHTAFIPSAIDEDSRERGLKLSEVLENPDAPQPLDLLMERRLTESALSLVAELNATERDIVERRFGLYQREQQSLREVGREYKLSRERIRQLEKQALAKMRAAMQ